MSTLHETLKKVTADDLGVDSMGRLVIHNADLAQAAASAIPNIKRIRGDVASNNCDCSMPAMKNQGIAER